MTQSNEQSSYSPVSDVRLGRNALDRSEVTYSPTEGPLLIAGSHGCGKSEAAKTLFTRLIDLTASTDSPVLALDGARQGYSDIALARGGRRAYLSEGRLETTGDKDDDTKLLSLDFYGTAPEDPVLDLSNLLTTLAADYPHDDEPTRLFIDPLDPFLQDDQLAELIAIIWRTARSRGAFVVATISDPSLLWTRYAPRPEWSLSSVLFMGDQMLKDNGTPPAVYVPADHPTASSHALSTLRPGEGLLEARDGRVVGVDVDMLKAPEQRIGKSLAVNTMATRKRMKDEAIVTLDKAPIPRTTNPPNRGNLP